MQEIARYESDWNGRGLLGSIKGIGGKKWVGTRWPVEGLIGYFSNISPCSLVFDCSFLYCGHSLTLPDPQRV